MNATLDITLGLGLGVRELDREHRQQRQDDEAAANRPNAASRRLVPPTDLYDPNLNLSTVPCLSERERRT